MGKYSVFVQPDTWQAAKQLPGNVRQRINRFIDDLENDPLWMSYWVSWGEPAEVMRFGWFLVGW